MPADELNDLFNRLRSLLSERTLFLTGNEVTIFAETRTQAEQLFDLLEELA